MPGFPLLNLGYGLGGLVQGYNNQQSQALQQSLQRLALQQAQGQQNAQSLASLALQAGLLGNNNVQTNPLQGLPQPQSPQVAVSAPQINVPQNPAPQPPPAAQPQTAADNNTPADTGIFDYNDAIAAGRAEAADAAANQQVDPRFVTPASQADMDRVDKVMGTTTSSPPPQSPPAPSQTASAGASDTTSTPAPSGNQQVGIQLPGGQTIDMSTMFKTVDYGKLAQGIAQLAPPGTSQADIFNAVLDLGKLADGDKVQQQQAGLLARALFGGNFKLAAIGQQQEGAMQRVQAQQAGAQQRVETQQAGATGRTQLQQAGAEQRTQEQIASREKMVAAAQELRKRGQDISNSNKQAALSVEQGRAQTAAQQAGRQDAALQISAVRARIGTIKPDAAGNYSDVQQKQLQEYNNQIADIAAKAAGAAP